MTQLWDQTPNEQRVEPLQSTSGPNASVTTEMKEKAMRGNG